MKKEPLPSQIRIAEKSLQHSINILEEGNFNPSGKGSKTYHINNIRHKVGLLKRWGQLLEVWLK